MVRDSSKCVLAGLMWAIITVRLFPPRASCSGKVPAGVTGTRAPTCLVVPPLPHLYQALLDHLGFLLQSLRRAAEVDQESVLGEVTLGMRQDLEHAYPI